MNREDSARRPAILPFTRRKFMLGCAAGAGLSLLDAVPAVAQSRATTPAELSGTSIDLTIDRLPVNFTGRPAIATAVNGSVPGPTLRLREGDTVTIRVANRLRTFSSIHWHGVRVPADMDGVPGLSFDGIAPGKTFVYRFPVRQNGTYWYHSHSGFEEQTGLIGALVIEPRGDDPIAFDRDYVILLSDWMDANPATVYSNLKEDSEYYNFHRRTAATFFSDVRAQGLRSTIADRASWARMNMTPTDISDVSGYTFLLNGNPPGANWTGLFRPGERIRLRFINGSSETFFDVRIPGLSMSVVAADGNELEPVTVDEFRMGVAEVYDVIVQPRADRAYTIFAQSEDRAGYARGTLAPRVGMEGPIPAMDPRPTRTMADMGMDGMSGAPGAKDMAAMPAMEVFAAGSRTLATVPPREAGDVAADDDGRSGTIPFPQPWTDTQRLTLLPGTSELRKMAPASPVRLHLGPQVDMISANVTERLSEPGDGLNGNGRRVLSYADLRARYRGVDGRPPTREIELHLTGNMERFIWGFDGRKFTEAEPIELKLGERVRFVLVNDTMMEHPIHLHGMWSELENGQGARNPYKHTVIVKPSERVSYLVSADTPGRWAYHCHLLYHMEAGMFRTLVVS